MDSYQHFCHIPFLSSYKDSFLWFSPQALCTCCTPAWTMFSLLLTLTQLSDPNFNGPCSGQTSLIPRLGQVTRLHPPNIWGSPIMTLIILSCKSLVLSPSFLQDWEPRGDRAPRQSCPLQRTQNPQHRAWHIVDTQFLFSGRINL